MSLTVNEPQVGGPSVPSTEAAAGPAGRSATTATTGGATGALRFVAQVLTWVFILAALAVLAVTVVVPRVTGSTPYTVLTGSMTPTYPPGTLVVDQQVDPADIHIGDPVTFQITSGQPEVVTHRVTAVRTAEDGGLEFQTKGDANDSVDPDWRPSEAVRGRVWYAVPHLGRVNTLLSGHQRQLAVYGVAGALVIYAGAMFAGAGRGRRRAAGSARSAAPASPVAPRHRA